MTSQLTYLVGCVRKRCGGFITSDVASNATVEQYIIEALPAIEDDTGTTLSGEIGGLIVPTPSGQPIERLLSMRTAIDLLDNEWGSYIRYAALSQSGLLATVGEDSNRVSRVRQFGMEVEMASQARASLDATREIRLMNKQIRDYRKDLEDQYEVIRRRYVRRRSYRGVVASARTVEESEIYSQMVVAAGGKLALDGVGNTYMKFNSTTGRLEIWVQGALIQEIS